MFKIYREKRVVFVPKFIKVGGFETEKNQASSVVGKYSIFKTVRKERDPATFG